MCGLFFFNSVKFNNFEFGKNAIKKLTHRGPDKNLILSKNNNDFFLGVNILSLTRDDDKNITSDEFFSGDRYIIAFNGEIYNFRALSKEYNIHEYKSDTDLISKLLQHVNIQKLFKIIDGMYSIIIIDLHESNAYFKRDLIGEKRLYYYDHNNTFAVSSEVSHLKSLNLTTTLNVSTLKNYFFTRHLMPFYNTCYNEIKDFEPGKLYKYEFKKKSLSIISTENLNNLIAEKEYNYFLKKDYLEIKNYLNELFLENANYLNSPFENYSTVSSGGLDSTTVTEFFLKTNNKPAYSIALNVPDKDELAKNLIDYYSKKKHKFILDEFNIEKFTDELKKVYQYTHSPLPTHSFVSQLYLSKLVNLRGTKCLIGGDGGDELFGGYELYKNIDINKSINLNKNPSPYSSIINAERVKDFLPKNEKYFNQFDNIWKESQELYGFIKSKEKYFQSFLFCDVKYQLEQVGLLSSDLMSMRNSVETRTFFASKKILSVALNLPIRYKFEIIKDQIIDTRPIIKDIYKTMTGLKLHPKQGFSGFPLEAGTKLLPQGKFKFINDLFNQNFNSFFNDPDLLWKAINLELYLSSCE